MTKQSKSNNTHGKAKEWAIQRKRTRANQQLQIIRILTCNSNGTPIKLIRNFGPQFLEKSDGLEIPKLGFEEIQTKLN